MTANFNSQTTKKREGIFVDFTNYSPNIFQRTEKAIKNYHFTPLRHKISHKCSLRNLAPIDLYWDDALLFKGRKRRAADDRICDIYRADALPFGRRRFGRGVEDAAPYRG